MPSRLHLETCGPIHGLPVLHNRLEFAWLTHLAVQQLKPDCIALELPSTLAGHYHRAVARLPQVTALRSRVAEQLSWLLVEPCDPFSEAARLAAAAGIPVCLIDADTVTYREHNDPLPDSYAVQRIGLKVYYQAYCTQAQMPEPDAEDLIREQAMALRLQELARSHRTILFVCGMFHLQRVLQQFSKPQAVPLARLRRDDVALFQVHPESCAEIMAEYPFLSALYEYRRGPLPDEPESERGSMRKRFSAVELIQGGRQEHSEHELLSVAVQRAARQLAPAGEWPDRQRALMRLFSEAARHYRQETGETVHPWQRRAFFRFARNYALISGRLQPDLYQLLTAARGCIDDNFAYAMLRLARCYPWQQGESADLPLIRLTAEELWGGARTLRFRPLERRSKGLSGLGCLKRRKEQRPGEWLEGFDDPSICSYPPEDIAIEQYGAFLKRKGTLLKAEEQARVEPFSTSLLDGIDMRETLRNLHEGRIYVREARRGQGDVGVVVMIFDEDRQQQRYPYLMTWLGEHNQESDMAFYATRPEDNIVGPGICRCEYGGFMLSYPPRRLQDVWQDPDYAPARSKAEVLLLAALDYSRERQIVYVAPRPPRSIFRQLAARYGKSVCYIPIGSISPLRLKRLRVMHVLAGRDKREIAKDFIW